LCCSRGRARGQINNIDRFAALSTTLTNPILNNAQVLLLLHCRLPVELMI
jgi:hypothetical protein